MPSRVHSDHVRFDIQSVHGIDRRTYRRRWLILAALCVGLVTAMIANMSLNLALPELAVVFSMTQLQLTWVVEAFTLVFAALLFVSAAIADRYGRKRTMIVGLGVFLAASLYAPLFAASGVELIVARAVMGLGGALVMPTTLSLVNVVFPAKERPKAIAIWTAVAGVGMMFGSVITGVLLHFFSWEAAFLVGAVLAFIALPIIAWVVPESVDEQATPVDWVGGALVTVALAGIVYTLMEAPSGGWTTSTVVVVGAAAASVATFVWWERRVENPMLDLALFRSRRFSLSVVSVTLTFFAMIGAFYSMTQIFQLVMGYDELTSALAMIPAMVPMLVLGPLVPRLAARFGTPWTVVPGLVAIAGGFAMMTAWPTVPSYGDFLVAMSTVTAGMALVMTPATNMLMASVPSNRSGMGSAMNDATRELGAAFGVALLGSLIAEDYTSNVSSTAAQLTGEAASAVESSLANAIAVSDSIAAQGGAAVDIAAQVASAAREAFMGAAQHAMLISALIAGATALLMLIMLPRDRATDAA
ncbi:MFS transporter [Demequina capsici]|uniref:MFS transporter n=1 Tax=Demequina capsici TaxID=3075620 RepID=A0AA96F4I7_9MICO|nr:MFS transporter [Demequina sp. OYTSA14]WNM23604.1 MFS transporter [Demequina sp. OYTSA14]